MVLLVPVYQPGDGLSRLVADMRSTDPSGPIVLVDDGSTTPVDLPGCTVLRHSVNRGKGQALRTGFAHIAAVYPGRPVVCADGDGQHSVEDILRVADRVAHDDHLVLGVRRVRRMPPRSRLGNAVTRVLFRAATGRWVRDTQTGLRGYPGSMLEWLGDVPGERFEYEMNVLLAAVRAGHTIEQVEIATTYLNGNASSHFGSLSDAARVYRSLLRFALDTSLRR
ncbi:glycosyltransferase family 2 protein [Actinoplanes sp. TRM 88003]|uniref:Glycosyltransferase family 2 protein n=1 Tax=Paractinoplanes aksuensis TaxID=2939490 RepID=A0ABT1DJ61_9ACTN|nr:glycosyltransferase family 2 protein [Actinoplanes aksuensis]MCO8270847.1 glycosyltransferase family 2 protein [Actinoplanes aksuensis]